MGVNAILNSLPESPEGNQSYLCGIAAVQENKKLLDYFTDFQTELKNEIKTRKDNEIK